MSKILKQFMMGLMMMICVGVVAMPTSANGAPIKIFLGYLPEISNYGSTEATGVALVSIGEAWVELTAEGLPELNGQLYEAWLASAEDGQMISLGKFNANADGQVDYFAEFEQLPQVDYRLFVITVEPDPDPDPQADTRQTLAGFFPNPELVIVSGTPTPTLVPGITPTPGVPTTLPVTGNTGFGLQAWSIGLLAVGLLALGVGLLYAKKSKIVNPKSKIKRGA